MIPSTPEFFRYALLACETDPVTCIPQRCDLSYFFPAPVMHMIRTQCTNTVLNSLFLDICSARTPPRVLPATTAPTAWTSSTTGLASRAPLVATRRLLARQIARPVLRGQRLPRGARHSVTAWQAPRRGRATSSATRLLPTWRRYTTRQTLQSRSSFDILTKFDAVRLVMEIFGILWLRHQWVRANGNVRTEHWRRQAPWHPHRSRTKEIVSVSQTALRYA